MSRVTALVFLRREPPFSDSKPSTIPVFPVSIQLLQIPFSDRGQVIVSLGHILLNHDRDVLKTRSKAHHWNASIHMNATSEEF